MNFSGDRDQDDELMDIDVSQYVTNTQAEDDQTFLKRTTLRTKQNIPTANNDQGVTQNIVAICSENSEAVVVCSKLASRAKRSFVRVPTKQIENIDSYRVCDVIQETELARMSDIVNGNIYVYRKGCR